MSGDNLPVPFDREIHRPVAVGYEKAARRAYLRELVFEEATRRLANWFVEKVLP